jgi:hypothetical protein
MMIFLPMPVRPPEGEGEVEAVDFAVVDDGLDEEDLRMSHNSLLTRKET